MNNAIESKKSVIQSLPRRARLVLIMGVLLITLMMLDSMTTAIGFAHGLGEANPVARLILEKSPMMFWFGGTINLITLTILVTWIVKDHPKLYRVAMIFMIVMIVLKSRPVIHNIIQILVIRGII
jgi:hypothetical protein